MSDKAKLGLVSYPAGVGPIELQREFDGAKELMDLAIAPSTLRMYRASWGAFCSWCAQREVDPRRTKPAGLAVYLWWLDDRGLKVGTIQCHYGAVVYFLRKSDPDLWAKKRQHLEASVAMVAIRRKQQHVPRRMRPVMMGAPLDRLLDDIDSKSLLGIRDRALILIGLCGAFRRSEIVSLKVSDLEFGESGLRITLRRSKTDQEGKGYVKGIPFAADSSRCAVRAVREWLRLAQITEGHVFRPLNRHGHIVGEKVTGKLVARVVKKRVESAGIGNARDFAGHSLRSGFVTSAIRARKNIDAVMRQTGHKTIEVLRDYIRYETVFDDNALDGLL